MPKIPETKTAAADNADRRILISGSFCYDVIFDCAGSLADAGAGAVFFAPGVRRVFGGCGGNIAFGLAQLGDAPLLMAAAGRDWLDYRDHLAKHNISGEHIFVRDDCFTAMAYIINDSRGGQMTVFHPGASAHAHCQSPRDMPNKPALAIVSPNGGAAMIKHSRDLFLMKTPFVFDPGQALGLLSADDLRECLEKCACAIFNADEFAAAAKMLGGEQRAIEFPAAMIITDGERGSRLLCADGESVECAAAIMGETADTTGCGDAYRAGLLYGILRNWQWQRRMQFAAVIAGIKARSYGGQQYQTTAKEVESLRQKFFG